MASNELLGTYLTDHLGGATAGLELAEALSAEDRGSWAGVDLAALVREIGEDRDTLKGLMGRLGIETSILKQAAGWVVERLSRLKMNERVAGSADLTRLLRAETLSLGIEGKLAMWVALKELAAQDARLAGTDFDQLMARARRQRQALEPLRLQAAVTAFAS